MVVGAPPVEDSSGGAAAVVLSYADQTEKPHFSHTKHARNGAPIFSFRHINHQNYFEMVNVSVAVAVVCPLSPG
jgi:hypothetical protein